MDGFPDPLNFPKNFSFIEHKFGRSAREINRSIIYILANIIISLSSAREIKRSIIYILANIIISLSSAREINRSIIYILANIIISRAKYI